MDKRSRTRIAAFSLISAATLAPSVVALAPASAQVDCVTCDPTPGGNFALPFEKIGAVLQKFALDEVFHKDRVVALENVLEKFDDIFEKHHPTTTD